MTTLTPHFRISIPDFAVKPWHSILASAFNRIDAVIWESIVSATIKVWAVDTQFNAGSTAIDSDDGSFWTSLTTHTSPSTGTFEAARIANPTYWGQATTVPQFKGNWLTGTQYITTDFVKNGLQFAVCKVPHTAGVFATDLADGFWTVLIDLTSTMAEVAAALVLFDAFEDVYLGAKTDEPILDNDGNVLTGGTLYFNTTTGTFKVFKLGTGWLSITTGAPDTAEYVVHTTDASLINERVLTDGTVPGEVVFDWSVSTQVTSKLRASGTGKFLSSNGANSWLERDITALALTLLDDATAADMRTTLGVGVIGALATVLESHITLADNSTNNASSTKHGFAPKSSADAATFLNGAATPAYAPVTDADLSTSDVTTNNASTAKHGFLKKLSNVATEFMNGQGNWTAAAPTAGDGITVAGAVISINTNNPNGIGAYTYATSAAGGPVPVGTVIAGSNLSPTLAGSWRNVSGFEIADSGIGLWIRTV